jgi:putative addiction module component (TIGR02574 family)
LACSGLQIPKEKQIALSLFRKYALIMSAAEIEGLSVEEKLRIMETIWEDFRERFDQLEISDDLKGLLDERRARVHAGAARLIDWDQVKTTLRPE